MNTISPIIFLNVASFPGNLAMGGRGSEMEVGTLEMMVRNFKMMVRTFEMMVKSFEMMVRSFEMMVRTLEMMVKSFEMMVRSFEMMVRSFEMMVRSFEMEVETNNNKIPEWIYVLQNSGYQSFNINNPKILKLQLKFINHLKT